jgi:hypothetical protein
LEFRGWRLDKQGIGTLLSIFGLALIISFWWFGRNALLYGGADLMGVARHDSVVIGQPTTAGWVAEHGLKNTLVDFTFITFRSFWAQFGWMGVLVNDRIYVLLSVLTTAGILGVVLWLFQGRARHGKIEAPAPLWGLLGAWLLAAILDYIVYNLRYFQPQGRYLFPALIPIAALFVVGLDEIFDKRYTRIIFGLLFLAMVALDYVSLFWFIIPQLRT